ncbi:MAG: CHAT domain-containing tetratricopeptide repeat protein [Bacteroidota bacterium]
MSIICAQDTIQYSKLSYEELDSLINKYLFEGKYSNAIPFANEMVSFGQKEQNDTLLAAGLHKLGICYYYLSEHKKALLAHSKAKDIREKVLGNDHPRFAESLNDLALVHWDMSENKKALPIYLEAKEIVKKVWGNEHKKYAELLNNLALLYMDMSNYNKALPLFLEARDIREKTLGKEHPYYAVSLSNLALLYRATGNYDKSLQFYLQAKDIREKARGKKHPGYAVTLNDLAYLYRLMGNYNKALSLFLQAKDIREETLGKDSHYYASSLYYLSDIYRILGHYNKALPLLLKAIAIQEKVLGKEHTNYVASIINLALVHRSMGNYNQALPLLLEAKELYEKILGKEHPYYAISLRHLAELYRSIGNYNEANLLLLEVIDIFKITLSKDHIYHVTSLNNLAGLYKDIDEYEDAWMVLYQALNNSSGLQLSITFNKVWFDSLLTAVYRSHKHLEEMVKSLSIAYELLEKDSSVVDVKAKQIIVSELANALLVRARNQVSDEGDKLRILALSHEWLQKSLEFLNPEVDVEKAFSLSDQDKSVLLLQATKSELAYQLGELPDSLVWKDRKLLKKQSELQAKLLGKGAETEKDSLRSELNQINFDIDEFVQMIETEYPKYHKLKYQRVDVGVKDVQTLLSDNDVLLEYVVGDSVMHIFYIDKHHVQWERSFVSDSVLKSRIGSLHATLSDQSSREAYFEHAHWFYQKLLAPVLEGKSGISNLIIVPDGELGHLPFETFLVEEASEEDSDYRKLHYLLRDYSISYNYSAALWKENIEAPAPQNNGQVLGVAANYGIALDSSMLAVRLPMDQWKRGELSPLPAAQMEVQSLQERYEGFFAFDSLASERVVKNLAPEFSVLHFATHGILDRDRPVLSSLAFSEDNDSTESNFWEAYEISKAQLNADMVVLSACQTGYGRFEQGNGMASLARAFMYAGSPALVVSLWQVSDRSTSELMDLFYDLLDGGMNKDEALRQAKLKYLESSEEILAHPSFWAPFIIMGKTEAIQLKRKSNAYTWFITLGILAMIGAGFFIIRRG